LWSTLFHRSSARVVRSDGDFARLCIDVHVVEVPMIADKPRYEDVFFEKPVHAPSTRAAEFKRLTELFFRWCSRCNRRHALWRVRRKDNGRRKRMLYEVSHCVNEGIIQPATWKFIFEDGTCGQLHFDGRVRREAHYMRRCRGFGFSGQWTSCAFLMYVKNIKLWMRLSSIACFGLPSLGYYCPVGRNSERRSKSFSTPDTILGIEKHELTVYNAAHLYNTLH